MNRSTFPEQIDSFTELYDLPPSMVSQAKRYQELKMKPTLTSTEQSELNSLSAQLSDFIISPETFNKFADAVVSLETFFTEQVMDYVEAKQTEWATYVNDFRVIGDYDETLEYKFQNMVTYNGDLYIATQDVVAGVTPEDDSNWYKLSSKGDKGDIGLSLAYKGKYDSTKTYVLGDAVTFQQDGMLYYANTAIPAGTDPTSTSWTAWDRHLVSETQPATHNTGTIWYKILP